MEPHQFLPEYTCDAGTRMQATIEDIHMTDISDFSHVKLMLCRSILAASTLKRDPKNKAQDMWYFGDVPTTKNGVCMLMFHAALLT